MNKKEIQGIELCIYKTTEKGKHLFRGIQKYGILIYINEENGEKFYRILPIGRQTLGTYHSDFWEEYKVIEF
jgi:hypothetical protein